jgi:beta-fructofuranosidase
MWECPDFFPLGKKHVLLYSTAGQVIWETGELDSKELVFHPKKRGVLDHGAYYAQKTQLDAKGNRILWGWIPEKRRDSELVAAGWAGCMALPRVLSLAADGTLEMRIVSQIESLRRPPRPLNSGRLIASDAPPVSIEGIKLESLAFQLAWVANENPWSFALSDTEGPWLSCEFSHADSTGRLTMNEAAFEIPMGNGVRNDFQMIVDGSVVETICNQREALTLRVYRKPAGPLTLSTHISEAPGFAWGEAWQLKPISKDRLTS